MIDSKSMASFVLAVAVMAAFFFVVASSSRAAIVAPSGSYHGYTYPQLQAKWWSFILSKSMHMDPRIDSTGELCSHGQSGDVWFLAGTKISSKTPVRRSCTVPAGKSLFVRFNNEAELNVSEKTMKSVPESASQWVQVWVDDVLIRNPQQYLSQSVAFTVELREGNEFNLPAGTKVESVVDEGHYLLLMPLSPGSHKIRLTSSAGQGIEGSDITYNLQVLGSSFFGPR